MAVVFFALGFLALAGAARLLVGPHVLVERVSPPETDTREEQ